MFDFIDWLIEHCWTLLVISIVSWLFITLVLYLRIRIAL